MEKINKLSLPASVIIGVFVLGGFYYATETSRQKSIVQQQEIKIETEKKEKSEVQLALKVCIDEASQKKNNSILFWGDYQEKKCFGLSMTQENYYCITGVSKEMEAAKTEEIRGVAECHKTYPLN